MPTTRDRGSTLLVPWALDRSLTAAVRKLLQRAFYGRPHITDIDLPEGRDRAGHFAIFVPPVLRTFDAVLNHVVNAVHEYRQAALETVDAFPDSYGRGLSHSDIPEIEIAFGELYDIIERDIMRRNNEQAGESQARGLPDLRVQLVTSPELDAQRTIVEKFLAEQGAAGTDAEVIGYIALLGVQIDKLREELDDAVSTARRVGIPWSTIGEAVGITAPAAYRRWDKEARRKHSDYQRRWKNRPPDGSPT